MARKPMVTRTITTTKATVMCLDITKGESFTKVYTLPRTYADDKKLLAVVQKEYDTEELKSVHIVAKEEIETLYGMTEADFIANATELDKETRKALDLDEE